MLLNEKKYYADSENADDTYYRAQIRETFYCLPIKTLGSYKILVEIILLKGIILQGGESTNKNIIRLLIFIIR